MEIKFCRPAKSEENAEDTSLRFFLQTLKDTKNSFRPDANRTLRIAIPVLTLSILGQSLISSLTLTHTIYASYS